MATTVALPPGFCGSRSTRDESCIYLPHITGPHSWQAPALSVEFHNGTDSGDAA